MDDYNNDKIQAIPRPRTNACQECLNDIASNRRNSDFFLRCGCNGSFVVIISLKGNGQAGFIDTLEKNIMEHLAFNKEQKKIVSKDANADCWNFFNSTSICPTYRRANHDQQTPIMAINNKGESFPFKNIIVFLQDPNNLDTMSLCTNMHDTCKRIISKGAKCEHSCKLKICDISADDEVTPLDQLLQDNCIFKLIENHAELLVVVLVHVLLPGNEHQEPHCLLWRQSLFDAIVINEPQNGFDLPSRSVGCLKAVHPSFPSPFKQSPDCLRLIV